MRLKIPFLTSVFLVAVGTCFCQAKEVYTITKTWPPYDVFKVPPSKCTMNVSNCTLYNNAVPEQQDPCTCICRHYASSFGFYSGSWTCLSNVKVRQRAGCQFMFHADFGKEIVDDPLIVLEQDTSYHAIFPSRSCSIKYASSRYFDCDGTWKTLRSKERSDFLGIIHKQRFSWDSDLRDSWKYTLRMSTTTTSLSGRIVSLYFNCTTPSRSSCLLFKIAGEITCPVVTDPLSTPNPISATLTTTIQSNFTKSPEPGNQTRHGHQGGSSSSSSSSLLGTVVAVVVIVIFVIILAVVIGFIFWKKTRGENVLLMDTMLAIVKKNRTPSTTPAVAEEAEEDVYSEIPDHLVQRQTTRTKILVGSAGINNYAFQGPRPQPIYASPESHYASLVRNSIIQEEPSTDEEGYLEPRQLPDYVEFESIEEQVTETGSTENSTTKNDEGQNQNEQQDASNGSGEGDGVSPVVYACVNMKRKLPNVPSNDVNTEQDKNKR